MPKVEAAARESEHSASDPEWVRRPWDETKSFFELLGVKENASAVEIAEAFSGHFAKAGANEQRLPNGVRHAHEFLLADDGQRSNYRKFLSHCRSRQPLRVPASEQGGVAHFCEWSRLKCWADPKIPDEVHLRLPGQEPPDFVVEALQRQSDREQQNAEVREQERRRAKRERHAGKRFFVRFGYVYGFGFATVFLIALAMTWSFDGSFDRMLRVLGFMDDREARAETRSALQLEREEREALALAGDSVSRLRAAFETLRADVQQRFGMAIDSSADYPADLDAALGRAETGEPAWREIRDAYAACSGLEELELSLQQISGRAGSGYFLRADIDTLKECDRSAKAALVSVGSQKPNIEHIQTLLQVERLARAGNVSSAVHEEP